jgi:hypothetical protein
MYIPQQNTGHQKETGWLAPEQGCQIFLGPKYQNGGKIYQITTKYTKWPLNISNGRKIDQMVIKYTKIFHCKTIQNLPKLGFLVWKQTIWQPCSRGPNHEKTFLRGWKFFHFNLLWSSVAKAELCGYYFQTPTCCRLFIILLHRCMYVHMYICHIADFHNVEVACT